jgi:hypothetical protein
MSGGGNGEGSRLIGRSDKKVLDRRDRKVR